MFEAAPGFGDEVEINPGSRFAPLVANKIFAVRLPNEGGVPAGYRRILED
jgi:hypothetical protein